MPMPRFRDSDRLRLTVSTARTERFPRTPDGPPLLPWSVAALGGGVLAGLVGAMLVAGVMLIAWLSAIAIPLPTVLAFAAQTWLLAHGGELSIGSDEVTLVPLGLTIGVGALCASAGRFAYRQGRQARPGDLTGADRRRLLLGSIGQVTVGYTGFAAVLAGTVGSVATMWRPVVGAFLLSAVGSAVGAVRASEFRPWAIGPRWWRGAARGAAAGILGLVVIGAVVLATAAVLGEARIGELESALGFDGAGAFVWTLVVLAYLPNLIGWALAWVLGAGFTVGTGSLVSLAGTQLGMLPAIPVLGALPAVGAADPWLQSWLVAGVVVGALAGVSAVRRGRLGVLSALAAAALAGLLVGLAYLAWAAVSRGGLGSLRLVDLGPRLVESVLIGVPLLLLSAGLGGLVTWLVRRRGAEA